MLIIFQAHLQKIYAKVSLSESLQDTGNNTANNSTISVPDEDSIVEEGEILIIYIYANGFVNVDQAPIKFLDEVVDRLFIL